MCLDYCKCEYLEQIFISESFALIKYFLYSFTKSKLYICQYDQLESDTAYTILHPCKHNIVFNILYHLNWNFTLWQVFMRNYLPPLHDYKYNLDNIEKLKYCDTLKTTL